MKILNSVLLSLFMASNEVCNASQAELYFQKTERELNDPKGPENIICTDDVLVVV